MNLKSLTKGAAIALIPVAGFFAWNTMANAEGILPVTLPAPAIDATASGTTETAVFAGGCFWGVQGVFQHVKGVTSAVSGYSGGTLENPTYEDVLTETTGHAEAVTITFDPTQVSYGKAAPDLLFGDHRSDDPRLSGQRLRRELPLSALRA